ncbi:hypothetical protein [Peribacillus frigoritolerans]|uniref:hypothetical protein n=1 Tax=Peribacillus frigoritolerans TaxID=450367 RepID=UPI0032E45199
MFKKLSMIMIMLLSVVMLAGVILTSVGHAQEKNESIYDDNGTESTESTKSTVLTVDRVEV